MKEERIKRLVEEKKLKPRIKDLPRIRSILESSERTAAAVQSVPLSYQTATIIFKEMYDAIRQLGDAKWWLLGYEPYGHDISIELLMEENQVKFQHLDRFRLIRHDANYRGYLVSLEQAKEILSFWDENARELLETLKKEII